MNKPVRKPDDHVPPSLAERLRPAVESGQFEGVGEAEFVATGALADRLEFGATDDVEAIRRSIEQSIAEDDYEDAELVFARLRARYEESGD
jgi:phage tail tube protein FII